VKILLTQISTQIQTLVSKIQHHGVHLSVIEEKLDISPLNQEFTPHEQSVLDNTSPIQKDPTEVTPPQSVPEDTSFDTDISFSYSSPSLAIQNNHHMPLSVFLTSSSSDGPNDLFKANQAHLTKVLDHFSSRVDNIAPLMLLGKLPVLDSLLMLNDEQFKYCYISHIPSLKFKTFLSPHPYSPPSTILNIGTFNINGLKHFNSSFKLPYVSSCIIDNSLHILCLAETHLSTSVAKCTFNAICSDLSFSHWWSASDPISDPCGGVGTVWALLFTHPLRNMFISLNIGKVFFFYCICTCLAPTFVSLMVTVPQYPL
jgi:hypothetical protein